MIPSLCLIMESRCKFIHDLPYKPRKELCRILDADRKWEELGGKHMKEDITTLTLIGQAVCCGKSPTWELLDKYSGRNGTVERLFLWLYKMDHHRAMLILEPYVDKKFHFICKKENIHSGSFLTFINEEDTLSSLSQLHITSTDRVQIPYQGSTNHISRSCGTSDARKEKVLTKNSKGEKANINQNYHANSSRSKCTDVPHLVPEVIYKRSVNLNQLLKNAHTQEKANSKIMDKKEKFSVRESNHENGKIPRHRHSSSGTDSERDTLPDFMHTPFSEICKATNNFNEALVLGKGGFGTVYKGVWKQTSVAIKRLTTRKSDSTTPEVINIKQAENELSILKCCRYDYILPLYAVSQDGESHCLVYQLMVNGSLFDRLRCKGKTPALTWSQRIHIAQCTAKGLNYLHTSYGKRLVHGDIKSGNILLDVNMDAKIGDFGLTRLGPDFNNTHVYVTSVHGTGCYLPDEYLRCKELSPEVDIYSYGIVMFEIATGLKPYDSKSNKRLIDFIKYYAGNDSLVSLRDAKAGMKNMHWFEELIKIGQDCSNIEKRKRPPMQEVIQRLENIKSTEHDIRSHLTDKDIDDDDAAKKERSNSLFEKERLSKTPAAIPLVIPEIESILRIPKEAGPSVNQPSCSVEESRGEMEPDASEVQTNQGYLSPKKEFVPERRVPIPLISALLVSVPDFAGKTDEGEKSCCSSCDTNS